MTDPKVYSHLPAPEPEGPLLPIEQDLVRRLVAHYNSSSERVQREFRKETGLVVRFTPS